MIINTLVISGDGINCERETQFAFKQAGSQTQAIHIQDFLELASLEEFDIIAFPGGFSYGDEIRSGKILAEQIKYYQLENLKKFIAAKKPIIGICNGFQILMQLGLFDNENKLISLRENSHKTFINKWCDLNIIDTDNLWLKNLPKTISLPIRHGEGRITVDSHAEYKAALTYTQNVNGSHKQIAGLSNYAGNILGLMPHPEAAVNNLLLPNYKNKKNQESITSIMFKNAVNYSINLKEELP
jgi:phosphoribosylformylglycinamidine synthase